MAYIGEKIKWAQAGWGFSTDYRGNRETVEKVLEAATLETDGSYLRKKGQVELNGIKYNIQFTESPSEPKTLVWEVTTE